MRRLNHKHVQIPAQNARLKFEARAPIQLPSSFDISAFGPPIWDQGNLGSCTAHASLRSVFYALKRHYTLIGKVLPISALSRAFVYACTRLDSGEPINEDDGGTIQDTFKAIGRDFTVDEAMYEYTPDHFFSKPPSAIYDLAKHTFHHCAYYQVPQNAYLLKHAIFTGRPVAFGAQVYSSFMKQSTMDSGVIPYPDTATETLEGGHAICLVGWDDAAETFLFANSWGEEVGLPAKRGYFTIPYKYVENPDLCSDFWFGDIFY